MQPVYCRSCGKSISNTDKFCNSCGEKQITEETGAALRADPVMRPSDSAQEDNNYQYESKREIKNTSGRGFFSPLLIIALILATPFILPLIFEGSSNDCSAVEQVMIRKMSATRPSSSNGDVLTVMLINSLQRMSDGNFAKVAMAKRYPDLPPFVACAVGYWNIVTNPQSLSGQTNWLSELTH